VPACPKCGFEKADLEECSVCARNDSRLARHGGSSAAVPRFAALRSLVLPAVIATALILAGSWLYLADAPNAVDSRIAVRPASAGVRPPDAAALDVAALPTATPPSATTALPANAQPAATAAASPAVAKPQTKTAKAAVASKAAPELGAVAAVGTVAAPPRSAADQALDAEIIALVSDPATPRISASIPTKTEKEYIAWMLAHTNETQDFLEKKWKRAQSILGLEDITKVDVLRAFLYTPREYFARAFNIAKAYDNTAIPIGYGQTISGPHMVSHMTSSIEPKRDDRILEIGTGSGYQSAVLSELCDHVYTIEIVPALFNETDGIYRALVKKYPEYATITRKNADGYYGWVQYAPFQKIVVTAGIDHIPPPLLRQLAPNGIMIIPVGPPSGQTVLKIVKKPLPGGGFTFERSDVFRGRKVIFVPFTAQGGARHSLDDTGTGDAQ
jgi:protein-L-isoaspartate(D-aspartate) O-methyltransferase